MKRILLITLIFITPLFSISQFQIDSIVEVDATCAGGSDGTLTIYTSGGVAPITYDIGTGSQTSNVFTGLTCGSYSVVVEDAIITNATGTGTINCPDPILSSIAEMYPICNGSCDGGVDIITYGGTGSYTVTDFFGGVTTYSVMTSSFGYCAGAYPFTVEDSVGCTEFFEAIILDPPLLIASVSTTDETFSSACDGTIEYTVSGGNGGPYIYDGFDCNTGDPITQPLALCAGDYAVTVTDVNGCTETSTCEPVNPGLGCNMLTTTNEWYPTCFGSCDGGVDIITVGGSGSYTVTGPFGDVTAYTSSANLFAYCAGTYSFLIDDGAGCTETIDVIFMEPAELIATVTTTDETFVGACDGTATAIVTGGVGGYTYLWQDCVSGSPVSQFGGTITNLCPSNYGVIVTDFNGCVSTSSCVTVIASTNCNVTSSFFADATFCNGTCEGMVSIATAGGVAPYTVTDPFGGVITYTSSTVVPGLCAGTYPLLIEDSTGCTETITATIAEPTQLVVSVSTTDESSSGACNGTAMVVSTGGTPGYTYNWIDCSTGSSINQFSGTATGLCPGDYKAEVTDMNACQAITLCETVLLGANCTMVSVYNDYNPICMGACDGILDISTTGGTAPYVVTDVFSSITVTYTSTVSLPIYCEGVYTLYVEDNVGCIDTLEVTFEDQYPLMVDIITTDESSTGACDGAVIADVTGGTPPYTYNWINCNTGDFVIQPSPLCPGSYFITVTDVVGCVMSSACDSVGTPSVGISTLDFVEFNLYPNPAGHILNVDCNNSSPITIHVFSITGELIYNRELNQEKTIDVSEWSPGLYILKTEINNTIVLNRFEVK